MPRICLWTLSLGLACHVQLYSQPPRELTLLRPGEKLENSDKLISPNKKASALLNPRFGQLTILDLEKNRPLANPIHETYM